MKALFHRELWEVEGDNEKSYLVEHRVETEEWHCTCPDSYYRSRECKHIFFIKTRRADRYPVEMDKLRRIREIIEA
jgi:hypothetical protein